LLITAFSGGETKIPVAGRLIEFTLSHRQTEAAEWKPVLEQVTRSLRFPGDSVTSRVGGE
jgi:hypothetical protein